MNIFNFRLLLVVYVLVFAADVLVQRNVSTNLPNVVYEEQWKTYNQSQKAIGSSRYLTACLVAIVHFLGLTAMFFLWRSGRILFLISIVLEYALAPILLPSWHAQAWWSTLFQRAVHLLYGVIIACAFFGPAKTLFSKEKISSSSEKFIED